MPPLSGSQHCVITPCNRRLLCLVGNFYSLPCLADFLLDELTGCCQDEIRTCAASCLKSLVDKTPSQESVEHPKYYLLQMVLGARLPYWVSHASTRGSRQVGPPHLISMSLCTMAIVGVATAAIATAMIVTVTMLLLFYRDCCPSACSTLTCDATCCSD